MPANYSRSSDVCIAAPNQVNVFYQSWHHGEEQFAITCISLRCAITSVISIGSPGKAYLSHTKKCSAMQGIYYIPTHKDQQVHQGQSQGLSDPPQEVLRLPPTDEQHHHEQPTVPFPKSNY